MTPQDVILACLEEANSIRYLHEQGLSYSDLANAFSLSKTLIAMIIRRDVWVLLHSTVKKKSRSFI